MRVSDLSGAELDYWVARAGGVRENWITCPMGSDGRYTTAELEDSVDTGIDDGTEAEHYYGRSPDYAPSERWDQAGPIIDREHIATSWGDAWQQSEIKDDGTCVVASTPAQWYAHMVLDPVEAMRRGARLTQHEYRVRGTGPTLLIAAMRAFVASKFGEVTPDRETT